MYPEFTKADKKSPCQKAMKKIRVGIIFGGRSGEHEVSIVSAASVINALDKQKYEATPIYINKKGQWLFGLEPKHLKGKGAEYVYLPPDPTARGLVAIKNTSPTREETRATKLKSSRPFDFAQDGQARTIDLESHSKQFSKKIDVIFPGVTRNFWRGWYSARFARASRVALCWYWGSG